MTLALAKKGIDVILTYNSKQAEANEVVSSIESLGQKAIALQLDAGNVKSFDGFIGSSENNIKEFKAFFLIP